MPDLHQLTIPIPDVLPAQVVEATDNGSARSSDYGVTNDPKHVRINSNIGFSRSGSWRRTSAVEMSAFSPESAQPSRRALRPEDQMHWLWLTFAEDEMEEDYCKFAYVISGFYGGKLWHFLAVAIILLSFIWYYRITHGKYEGTMFVEEYWVAMTATCVVTFAMFVCCFIERLARYRETLFLISLFTHWPAFLICFFFGLNSPFQYTYMMILGCLFFCSFVVQARFSRVVWFLTVSPIFILIVTTFTFPYDFWKWHSYVEIVYWGFLPFPVILLHFYERNSRRSYLAMIKCEERIHEIESKIQRTQGLIAHFFPKTPTLDLLTEGKNMDRSKCYEDTTLVVTDLAGFTAWTSRTPPSVVIASLSQMFDNIDEILEMYSLEKISTVGDCFIGGSFPRSHLTKQQRCALTIAFCVHMLPYGGELQLRIGAHVGQLTGAFVGSAPPKFDIFGDDVELAKTMEHDGIPGMVHVTKAILDPAREHGAPVGTQDTELGIAMDSWEMTSEKVFTGVHAEADDNNDDPLNEGANAEFSQREVFKISEALTTMSKEIPTLARTASMVEADSAASGSISPVRQQPDVVPLGNGSLATDQLQQEADTLFSKQTSSFIVDSEQPQHETSSSVFGETSMLHRVASTGGLLRRGSTGSQMSNMSGLKMNTDPVFHPVFLSFENPVHERMFAKQLTRQGLLDFTLHVLTILQLFVATTSLMLVCMHTEKNRALAGCQMVVIMFNIIFLRRKTSQIKHLTLIIMCSYSALPLLAIFMDADCSTMGQFYVGTTTGMYILIMYLGTQFILFNRLTVRYALNIFCSAFGLALNAIRTNGVGDEAFPYDAIWIVGMLALGFVSYFTDFTLRSGFVADRKLTSVLKLTKGRHHKQTKAALEVMLPGFVSARLLGEDNGVDSSNAPGDALVSPDAASPLASSANMSMSSMDMDEDVLDTSNLAASDKLWEFQSVCVMFVYFDTGSTGGGDGAKDAASETFIDLINLCFGEIESILRNENIHKIKTIQTAVMCVCGINEDEPDPVNTMVRAAISIRRRVFSSRPDWKFTFGLHLGPCTGAVMGKESLMFDIFGDSVNMASRMASNAPPKGIQLSPNASWALADEFETEQRPPIQVKGKGLIEPVVVLGFKQ